MYAKGPGLASLFCGIVLLGHKQSNFLVGVRNFEPTFEMVLEALVATFLILLDSPNNDLS